MIKKSALLLFKTVEAEKCLMMVQAYDKPFLLLPGGKQEPGETIVQALRREISEELSVGVNDIVFLDKVTGFTPDNKPLVISMFTGTLASNPEPSREIERVVWVSRKNLSTHRKNLTPITLIEIFPCLARHRLF